MFLTHARTWAGDFAFTNKAGGIMKKLLLLLICAFFVGTGPARAESIKLGGVLVDYETPANYVLAEGGVYEQIIAMSKKAMGDNAKIHALFVDKEVDGEFRFDPLGNTVDDYLILVSYPKMYGMDVARGDFAQFKQILTGDGDMSISGEKLREYANKALDDAMNGRVQVNSIQFINIFKETEDAFSFLLLVTQTVGMGGDGDPMLLGVASSHMLLNGKIVSVNHYRIISDVSEVESLPDDNMAVIKSMKFRSVPAD